MSDLWSDKHSHDDCGNIEHDVALYNLYEDIQCLKEEKADFEHAITGYELGISSQQDEIEDLNRLISAWRSIAERARKEIEAQQITINKLNARCDRDDKLIFQMKDEISKLKAKNNNLDQKLEASEKRVQTARSLLDDAFGTDGYDCQGVNQAHRVLSLGKPPKETKLEE